MLISYCMMCSPEKLLCIKRQIFHYLLISHFLGGRDQANLIDSQWQNHSRDREADVVS